MNKGLEILNRAVQSYFIPIDIKRRRLKNNISPTTYPYFDKNQSMEN